MNKKHIRTIIISALVLLFALTTIYHIDVEPVDKASQSSVKKAEKQQEKPQEKETPSKEVPAEKNIAEDIVQANTQSISADIKPQEQAPANPQQHFCTIEIRCDTVKDTSKLENQAVAPYVPQSGVILETTKVEFTPGENVFDILFRATREKNIHMEFRDDNIYSGKYIEGINYLYEMDGGPLSGWMYKVNSRFPNYGCASYTVKDGDAIVWMYTCDLGVDVGDNSTW